jgi:predicted hotdog family 3-hydroxylacyl-ACP dehydratase
MNENVVNIKNYLPHRPPMLMVDVITDISANHVFTSFEIKPNNIFIENNCFNEMGLIENAAQTCSAIIGQHYFFDENHKELKNVNVVGFIQSIKKINVYRLISIGNQIITKARLISTYNDLDYKLCSIKCETFENDEIIFETELSLMLKKV